MIKKLFPVLSIVVAIMLFFLFTDPKLDEIKLLQQEEVRFDTALAQTLTLNQVIERLESQFNKLPKEGLARLEKMLIGEVDPTRLIYDINNIAMTYGKQIEEISVSDILEKKEQQGKEGLEIEPNSVSVSFNIEATYSELLDFIRDLEQSLQIVDIEIINFIVGEEFQGQDKLMYRIVLRAYIL